MTRKTAAKPSAKSASRKAAAKQPRYSRQRRPEDVAVEDWQIALRRQFGREQRFQIENLGDDAVFSEFAVTNPESAQRYRVAIRGPRPGENYCACPDFTTNGLGTCKHIEFTLARIAAKRGGKAALKAGFHPVYSEVYLDYVGQRVVRLRLGTGCPSALRTLAATIFVEKQNWALPPGGYGELHRLLAAAEAAKHELRCYDDTLSHIAVHRDGETRRRILDECYPRGATSPALKNLLKAKLYPYQIEGALFAVRAGRALIGDEMGLGKTVQAIAAMELFARHFGVTRVLIVCPTSLKHQWKREIAKFAERDVQVIGGLRAARQAVYGQEAFCKITNYETLARDSDLILNWAPDMVIVDEAQRIKNWNTIAARALKRIVSPYALVLTGTPLENRLEELISIVQFVDQHCLGPTWRLLHEHQRRDDHGRVIGYRQLDRIGATLEPIMLRRRKAQVLAQLPPRVDNTLFVPLTPQQRMHHDENGDIVARIVHRWRRSGYISDADQKRLTCALQNMRMSCNSTFLLDHTTDFSHKPDELVTLLDDILEQPEAKAVVFSQWLRTHELIARRLNTRGWGHVLFHGGVPGEQRSALVDRFNTDPECRLFLSTDAGGVGLNLQHAAACIVNMDMPWNPAVLEQRIGRVYRMGQTKSVQVVNFVAQGSIEEGMLSLLAFKKSLFAGVLDGGQSEVFLQGTRLAKFMESVEKVTGAAHAAAAEEAQGSDAQVETGDVACNATEVNVATAASVGLGAAVSSPRQEIEKSVTPPTQLAATDAWAPLLEIGIRVLQGLAEATSPAREANGETPGALWIDTDSRTGQQFLKLPLPEPQTVQRLADSLQALLSGLRRP